MDSFATFEKMFIAGIIIVLLVINSCRSCEDLDFYKNDLPDEMGEKYERMYSDHRELYEELKSFVEKIDNDEYVLVDYEGNYIGAKELYSILDKYDELIYEMSHYKDFYEEIVSKHEGKMEYFLNSPD